MFFRLERILGIMLKSLGFVLWVIINLKNLKSMKILKKWLIISFMY